MKRPFLFKIFICLFLLTVLEGCGYGQSREVKTFRAFPAKGQLEHSVVQVSEPITPNTIHLIDNTVVLVDRNAEHAIQFYDIKDWSLKGVYGRRGDGPGEMKSPKFHGQFVREKDETYLWFSDIRNYKLKKIGLQAMIGNSSAEPNVSLRLPAELALSYKDIFAINNNEFIGTIEGDIIGLSGNENAGRFFRFEKGEPITWIANFPEQKLEVPQKKVGYLYASRVAFNNQTNRLASGMVYYDRVDFVSVLNNEVITVVQEDNQEVNEVDLNGDGYLIPLDVTNFYVSAYGTKNFVYFFYSNSTNQQVVDYYDGKSSSISNLQLHVYDWNATPIYRAELDKWALGSFFVDEQTWQLYATDSDPVSEDEIIVSYQLPKLLNE